MDLGRDAVFISDVATAARTTFTGLLGMDHPVAQFVRIAFFWDAGATILVILLAMAKRGGFRLISISVVALGFPVACIAAAATGTFQYVAPTLGQTGVVWVLALCVWGTYLQRSRRVRVTFEHQALSTDPILGDAAEVRPSMTQAAEATASAAAGTVGTLAVKAAGAVTAGAGALASSVATSAAAARAAAPAPASFSPLSDEVRERIWAVAIGEFDGPGRRSGLYAEAFATADGDETKTKVAYLRRRVKELELSAAAKATRSSQAPTSSAPSGREAPALLSVTKPDIHSEPAPRTRPDPGLPLGPFVG